VSNLHIAEFIQFELRQAAATAEVAHDSNVLGMRDAEPADHLQRRRHARIPVSAIDELIRGDAFYWGQLMAAALLGSIPVAIIYSFFVERTTSRA
jgi:hypothetical protein